MLLVGPTMPDRSRMMTQIKRDTLALQVGGLGVRQTIPFRKKKYWFETSEEDKTHPGL